MHDGSILIQLLTRIDLAKICETWNNMTKQTRQSKVWLESWMWKKWRWRKDSWHRIVTNKILCTFNCKWMVRSIAESGINSVFLFCGVVYCIRIVRDSKALDSGISAMLKLIYFLTGNFILLTELFSRDKRWRLSH